MKAQGVLMWRNVIGLAAIAVAVNITLLVVRSAELSVLSTVLLLALLKTLAQIVYSFVGEQIVAVLFPPVEAGAETESNRIRTVDELCALCDSCNCCRGDKCGACETMKNPLVKIAACAGLLVLFKITGTFWIIFLAANIALFVPGLIMFPQVNEQIMPFICKQKAD